MCVWVFNKAHFQALTWPFTIANTVMNDTITNAL